MFVWMEMPGAGGTLRRHNCEQSREKAFEVVLARYLGSVYEQVEEKRLPKYMRDGGGS